MRLRSAMAVASTAIAFLLAAPLAASAAPSETSHGATVSPQLVWHPGGCNKQSKGGFTASACINQSGGYLNADAYISVKPSGCFQLEMDIRDVFANKVAQGNWQTFCSTGHYIGPSFWASQGTSPWYTELTIVSGSSSYVIDSPYEGYSWS